MVYTEGVEDGGVEIVDVDGVADNVVAELVGFTVYDAAFHSTAGHPDGEATWMVIASEVG